MVGGLDYRGLGYWGLDYRRRTVSEFFQAVDGIRDYKVTGVQTCALPISGDAEEIVGGAIEQRIGILSTVDLYNIGIAVRGPGFPVAGHWVEQKPRHSRDPPVRPQTEREAQPAPPRRPPQPASFGLHPAAPDPPDATAPPGRTGSRRVPAPSLGRRPGEPRARSHRRGTRP